MCKVGTGYFCINLISKNVETHINDEIQRDIRVLKN